MATATMAAPVAARELGWTPRQLELIKTNCARDLDAQEFNYFIEVCRRTGHDPLLGEIGAYVTNKAVPAKRSVLHIVKIQGLRARAERQGNYRPDEDEFELVTDPALKSETNPLGIEKAKVRVWKLDAAGAWNRITGVAYWDEYAPIREIWSFDNDQNKFVPTGRMEIDRSSMWPRMGRHMLAKCAEALAITKGWPDQTAGLHVEEQVDKVRFADATAMEIVEREAENRRLMALNGKNDRLMVDWMGGAGIEQIHVDLFLAAAVDWHNKICTSPEMLDEFWRLNRQALIEFKAKRPNDLLSLKGTSERCRSFLEARAAAKAEAQPPVAESPPLNPRLQAAMAVAPVRPASELLAGAR